jgi:hypothetical protein
MGINLNDQKIWIRSTRRDGTRWKFCSGFVIDVSSKMTLGLHSFHN